MMRPELSASAAMGPRWVTVWAGSAQGPYPVGNSLLQPDLSFVFPVPEQGATDQTFRLMVTPSLWGRRARIRLSNIFGTEPVTFLDAYIGVQCGSASLVAGSNRRLTFNGSQQVTVPSGCSIWSDGVDIDFGVELPPSSLLGRRLAVSFCVRGRSGPITWHAKALTTSYVSPPGSGPCGAREDEAAFPYAMSSWFFLDALDMAMPAESFAVVALGDSITEGTGTTHNGHDRWTDVLARRLHRSYGNRIAVVNTGIGGNQILHPAHYGATNPFAGGPPAVARIDRDVLDLSGVGAVIWTEGINDFSRNGKATLSSVREAISRRVADMRARRPDLTVIGGTLPSCLGSTSPAHGFGEQDAQRRGLNDFIRSSGTFDGVIDFDAALTDPSTGRLRPEFVSSNTLGGPGDGLHPNRGGHLAMASAIDLALFEPILRGEGAWLLGHTTSAVGDAA